VLALFVDGQTLDYELDGCFGQVALTLGNLEFRVENPEGGPYAEALPEVAGYNAVPEEALEFVVDHGCDEAGYAVVADDQVEDEVEGGEAVAREELLHDVGVVGGGDEDAEVDEGVEQAAKDAVLLVVLGFVDGCVGDEEG